jgi:hypothetical protein
MHFSAKFSWLKPVRVLRDLSQRREEINAKTRRLTAAKPQPKTGTRQTAETRRTLRRQTFSAEKFANNA